MKYRRLNQEELNELEPEFVRFLAANHVTATDWETLKKEKLEKVERLIEMFSDIVFEKILSNVQYMELKKPRDLRTFHLIEDRIKLIGLVIDGETELDFTKSSTPEEMMQQMRASNAEVRLYAAERIYRRDRDLEAFELMEQGALISKDGSMYKTLYDLRSSQYN